MSPSAKPRFAGRQPSSRWGAPGDDPAAPDRCGKRESEEHHVMTATPTRSTAAVWRPGDPVGDRRFAAIGDLALERGGVLPDVTVAYETWGTLSPSGDNAVLVEHALTGDSHVVGDAGPGHAVARLVARPHRSRRAARHRPPLRRREQRPRRVPGHDRARIRRAGRPAVGRPLPVHHDPRPGRRGGGPGRRARHRALARGARRLHGRDAGSRVGRDPPATASSAPSSSRPPRTPRPTRWRGASRSCSRSGPTRPTGAATTTTPTSGPSPAWASPDGSRTPPIGTRPSSTSVSGGGPGRGRTRSVGVGATTSRATSTTTPPSSPGASTPTATSCSPRR